MEDQQNSKMTEQPRRRRRAVRSVPMGNSNESTAAAEAENLQKPVRMGGEVPSAAESSVIEAVTPTESVQMTAEVPKPMEKRASQPSQTETVPTKTNTPAPSPKPTPAMSTPQADDVFSVERTFSPPQQTKRSPSLHIGAVAAVIVVMAVICMITVLPFMRTTEAVMLYVDEMAVGYLEHEDVASAQMDCVIEDLHTDADEIMDADETLYRCETTAVRGKVSYLSSDAVYDALFAQATDGYVYACCIPRDTNEWIGVLTEAELFAAADAAKAIFTERYTSNLPTDAKLDVGTDSIFSMFFFQWIPEEALMDTEEMAAAMVALQDTPYQVFHIVVYATETVAERIPYETTLVPNDDNFDGIRTMISAGTDGLAEVTYKIWLDPETGAELSREETARVIVREPVSAVSYEGLYPLPDGVSTGTFDWPLPELPDDELPLDENGNPYVPENPLALKNTYVSSGYGDRILWGEYDFHLGLDIVAPAYTEIYAADGGVVVYAAYTSSYGYMTRIRHADNVETVYAHQIKLVVKPGDVVEKGQLIGYVGSTGNTSGNHLHLEFRRDHVTVDPLEYITIPEDITVLGEGY